MSLPILTRRAMIGGALASLVAAGHDAAAHAAPDPYLRFVDPELRPIAAALLQQARPPVSSITLATEREAARQRSRPPRTDVPVTRKMIPGHSGQPDVAIYTINAMPGASRACILHTHGGGFVTGTALESVPVLQDLCQELGVTAVTVDYRLAPETSFRGSMEDNYAGLKWVHDHAEELGIDPARMAVMGESAGGGHAALLAISARDRGEVPLAFQCLVYPMLDDRTGTTRKAPGHTGRLIWDAPSNHYGWRSFLGREPGLRNVPHEAVPARLRDMAGLPPAFIGVGGLDLFLDEDVDYARRLSDAGVATQLLVVPGAFHAFDGLGLAVPNPRLAPWFNAAKKDALRRALALS